MLRVPKRTSSASNEAAARLVGMRRVSWVRITVVDGHTRCDAVGVGHRLPSVRPVSLDTAVALTITGVPSVIRTSRGGRVPETAVAER